MSDYTRQWLPPMKLRESCVDPFVPDVRDAQFQLHRSVVEGTVRARHRGRLLTLEEAHAFRQKNWGTGEDDFYELPADIELSVEDAERIWGPAPSPPESHHSRSQPARERVQHAIEVLYPHGVPHQRKVTNKELIQAVNVWLKREGLSEVSRDTVLRAAGRRSK